MDSLYYLGPLRGYPRRECRRHSIEYGPVAEQETFHAFALRGRDGAFAAFAEVEEYAKHREIPVVPVLFRGRFRSVAGIRAFLKQAHAEPSALGGERWSREGVVLRLAQGFPAAGFRNNVCKSVRAGEHVQTDEHWTRKWRPCRIARQRAGPPHSPRTASPHTSSKG